jgi:starvation-inducible outer membrane lipoprotein
MISLNGIYNALWCILAFGIVACAATPMSLDNQLAAVIVSNDDQAMADHAAAGSP